MQHNHTSIFKDKKLEMSEEEREALKKQAKAYDERELRHMHSLSESESGLTGEVLEELARVEKSATAKLLR